VTELEELQKAAEARRLTWEPVFGTVGEYYSLGHLAGDRVLALKLGAIGSSAPEGSAFTCHRALAETGATSVIGVGTAFAVNEDVQSIGDVLVSTALFLYQESTAHDDSVLGVRHTWSAEARIAASQRWVERLRAHKRAGGTPEMHFGVVLTGSTRVESARYRDQLANSVPRGDDPIVGGEMEASGIAAACRDPAQWVVVKGISDFGTRQSRKQLKATRVAAARSAANCVLDVLSAG
jgi:nucleoside phosphorylase